MRSGGVPSFHDLPDEAQIDLLAYILHRRSSEGFLDSLAPASARDLMRLENLKREADAKARAKAAAPTSADPALEEFMSALATARP